MKFDLEQVAKEIAEDKQFWEELTQIATDWYNEKKIAKLTHENGL